MKKSVYYIIISVSLAFVLSACNLFEQKRFSHIKKVPANPIETNISKDYPTPSEINFDIRNCKIETTENHIPYVHNDKSVISKDRNVKSRKDVGSIVKDLLFPDFNAVTAKISVPEESRTDGTGITITLVSLALLIAIILYHVITKNNIGCFALIVILFCIAFIIMGLVM